MTRDSEPPLFAGMAWQGTCLNPECDYTTVTFGDPPWQCAECDANLIRLAHVYAEVVAK